MDTVEYGYLIVNVFTAGGAIPIQGASVTVIRVSESAEPSESDIVGVKYTDSSGVTEKLALEAPPRSYSEAPGSASPPFARYNVSTEKSGYYTVRNINLPIYSGVTSIQPVELVPVSYYDGVELYPENDVRFNESRQPNL